MSVMKLARIKDRFL